MSRSALILAGGRGKRLGFQEKALIDINGKPLISLAIESLEKVVDEIIISVRDREQGELLKRIFPGFQFAYDKYENKGPLAGILSGLSMCRNDYCIITACDMPFINADVVNLLFSKCKDHDAAIPRRSDGFLEPLHAVYKTSTMINETKKALENSETTILAPISRLHVNYVPFEEISNIDHDLTTFMNINTYEDVEKLSKLILCT